MLCLRQKANNFFREIFLTSSPLILMSLPSLANTSSSINSIAYYCTSLEFAADEAPSSGCTESSELNEEGIQIEAPSKAVGTALAYTSTGAHVGKEETKVFGELWDDGSIVLPFLVSVDSRRWKTCLLQEMVNYICSYQFISTASAPFLDQLRIDLRGGSDPLDPP